MPNTPEHHPSPVVSLFGDRPPGAPEVKTVLVVDDQPLFRDVARVVLEKDGGFSVVAEAENGTSAVRMVERVRPDVVVMDVQMAGISGIEATRQILSRYPRASVVLMSMGGDSEYHALARAIGARGFVTKRELNCETLRDILEPGPESEPGAMAA